MFSGSEDLFEGEDEFLGVNQMDKSEDNDSFSLYHNPEVSINSQDEDIEMKKYIKKNYKTRAVLKPGIITAEEVEYYHFLKRFNLTKSRDFESYIHELVVSCSSFHFIDADSIQILHSASIEFLLDLFEGSSAFMRHSFRTVLLPEDMWQYLRLKGQQIERPFGDPLRSEDEEASTELLPDITSLQEKMRSIDHKKPFKLSKRDFWTMYKYEEIMAKGKKLATKSLRIYNRLLEKHKLKEP